MQKTYKTSDESLFKIFSFYNKSVNPIVPIYQKAVFKHFGFNVHQIYNNEFSHGDFLNDICRTITNTRFIIIFDIDCIPVNKNWFEDLMADLQEDQTLVGAAQTANHLREGKNLYVSPFFFAISTNYLKFLDYPDMRMTEQICGSNNFPNAVDAGQHLSEVITLRGGKLKYWWPTHVEQDKWPLYNSGSQRFGPGTTYRNNIYHAFYSRNNLSTLFIIKCKSILKHDPIRFRVQLSISLKKVQKSLLTILPNKKAKV